MDNFVGPDESVVVTFFTQGNTNGKVGFHIRLNSKATVEEVKQALQVGAIAKQLAEEVARGEFWYDELTGKIKRVGKIT